MSAEELVKAIREATTLRALKLMVGPSNEENEKAGQRILEMDKILERNMGGVWPPHEQQRFDFLMTKQDEFESMYA